jgi:hypothetical protein
MAHIVIKDLPESSELDRQAMLAIAGGSRLRAGAAGAASAARAGLRRIRLFDLAPAGGGAGQAAPRPPSR